MKPTVTYHYELGNVIARIDVDGKVYWSEMRLADFLAALGIEDLKGAVAAVKATTSYAMLAQLDELTKAQAREIHRMSSAQSLAVQSIQSAEEVSEL